MIGTIDIQCHASHPEIKLPGMYTYVNSPSSIRIIDVPKKIGKWKITDVFFQVTYPDNSITSIKCTLVSGVWVGTLPKPTVVGKTVNGFTITADGIDENDNDVNGYVLGVGDVYVLDGASELQPEKTGYQMRLLSGEYETLNTGDVYPKDGKYYLYQNDESHLFSGITSAEVSATCVQKINGTANQLKLALNSNADMPYIEFLSAVQPYNVPSIKYNDGITEKEWHMPNAAGQLTTESDVQSEISNNISSLSSSLSSSYIPKLNGTARQLKLAVYSTADTPYMEFLPAILPYTVPSMRYTNGTVMTQWQMPNAAGQLTTKADVQNTISSNISSLSSSLSSSYISKNNGAATNLSAFGGYDAPALTLSALSPFNQNMVYIRTIAGSSLTSKNNYYFPINHGGTFAMTSDITEALQAFRSEVSAIVSSMINQ